MRLLNLKIFYKLQITCVIDMLSSKLNYYLNCHWPMFIATLIIFIVFLIIGYNSDIKNWSGSSERGYVTKMETETNKNNFYQWFVGFSDAESCFNIRKSSKLVNNFDFFLE